MKRWIHASNESDSALKVAQNPNTPPQILAKLAEHGDGYVEEAVAQNPNTPSEVLDTIINNYMRSKFTKSSWAAYSALGNLNMSPETLTKLANELSLAFDRGLLQQVAQNPNTPPETLMTLSNRVIKEGEGISVLEWVAQNPNTPVETLRKLATHDHVYVRRSVAKNPNTPSEILENIDLENTSKKKSLTWKSLIGQIASESKDGIDSFYDETGAGLKLQEICQEVESKLGLYLEPSIQGGTGGIFIYDEETNEEVGSVGYETYNNTVLDMAISSTTKSAFQKAYKEYLQSLI